MDINIEELKTEYGNLLRGTGREGVDAVLAKLAKMGFFEAPASATNHLNVPGGLLVHSLNVHRMAMSQRALLVEANPDLATTLAEDSITLCALLHDVCKADIYKAGKRWRKNDANRWESYDGYSIDRSNFPIGHGEKSVVMLLLCGMKLSQDEMLAIRWHMGAWSLPFQSSEDRDYLDKAKEKSPLVTLLQCADMLAAGILEK